MIKIDLYKGNISKLIKNTTPEELLEALIESVDRDMREYFYISIENFDSFYQINDPDEWKNDYWNNLHWHLSKSIKEFLQDNGYDFDDLMVNAKEIFKKLIEESREMFPDGIENDL